MFEGPISASEVEKEPEKAVVENVIVFDSLALTLFGEALIVWGMTSLVMSQRITALRLLFITLSTAESPK